MPWLCLIALLAGVPSWNAGPEGFGRLSWGTERAQVTDGVTLELGVEGLAVVHDPKSQFAGRSAERWLYFVEGELAAVVLILMGQDGESPSETEIFTAMRGMLRGVYGPSRQVEASEIPEGWLARNDASPGRLSIVEDWKTAQSDVRLSLEVVMEDAGAPLAEHRLELISRARRAKLLELLASPSATAIEARARLRAD